MSATTGPLVLGVERTCAPSTATVPLHISGEPSGTDATGVLALGAATGIGSSGRGAGAKGSVGETGTIGATGTLGTAGPGAAEATPAAPPVDSRQHSVIAATGRMIRPDGRCGRKLVDCMVGTQSTLPSYAPADISRSTESQHRSIDLP
jgi:hypothetical protein